ncbi:MULTISPECIES: hypothetical protein [unclassified Anaeromyxobacter]|uniref:hypothetical protein n=1 Tax=unclassified Anaeromyxobacter TaxID=2620896 RepID=UPI001F584F9F|nr:MULTISPECIES: hypothetical protein [unclassified Anaeromyxobacter]
MRVLAFCALALPLAAAAQLGPSPSLGEAMHSMDRMEAEKPRPRRELEQTFILPERPGQNQVAWFSFDWQFIDVPPPGGGPGGLRLYYYRNELAQAERALPAIQSAYARLVDQFHYNPTKRIPYILYATQREFQTQNVFAVTESVLGVTSPEDLKMTVPYFGDHARFIEVSTHEMVHQFTIQKLLEAAGAEEMSSPIAYLPLWFIEGIAEFYSKGGIDTETDLYLRDLVWNPEPRKGYDVLSFGEDRIRGYIPTYKLGQARIAFIADQYGHEKIQAFLENAYLMGDGGGGFGGGPAAGGTTRNFGALVRRVLNEPIEQVDARWRAWLKRRYYPQYLEAKHDLPQLRELRQLPSEPEDFVSSADGNLILFRGIDREKGRARLYLVDVRNPRSAVEIVSDSVPGFESLHPVEYGVLGLGDGILAFSAQDGIGDRLHVQRFRHKLREGRPPRIELGRRRKLDVHTERGQPFIQISDPAFSPDGSQIAFAGVSTDGQSDIYVVPVKGGVARRITQDPYVEKDVAWGKDGIYFSSDATDHGRLNLFRIDPSSGERTRLTTAASTDRAPFPQADGSVLFTSDVSGKPDLYLLKAGAVQRITDFTTGLTSPGPSPKGRGVFASTFYGGVFRIVEVPKVAWLEQPSVAVLPPTGDVLEIPSGTWPEQVKDYDAFAIRNWRPEAGFVYGGGAGSAVAGRAAVLFSDMLRDNVLFVDLSVYGSFDYTQGLLLFENRARRLSWVLGGFHFVQQNLDRLDPNLAYYQRDFGVVGALRYPLDRFRRVETELTLGGVQRYCLTDFSGAVTLLCQGPTLTTGPYTSTRDWESRNGGVNFTISPTVRYGYDTIRYDQYTGPVAGSSLLLELGGGYLPGREAVHGFFRADTEKFWQLVGRSNFMLRAAGGTTFSPNEKGRVWEKSWWLTSADNLRGFYPLDLEFLIGQHYYVVNAELQFPLDPLIRLLIFDYLEGVAALDFGGVFNRWESKTSTVLVPTYDPTTGSPLAPIALERFEPGAWDARTLTGVLGVNVLFGPLLLRVHFGHPFDIGGLQTPALRDHSRWVTNITLRYFFF